MLEAVENQSPDVIIVDEISNAQEVRAAQTIAQRGVMLIATVHGISIAELIDDRERSPLVGGCSTVTLSGREAERRSDKKKQVLKRSREPVFQAALELQSRSSWIFHNNVADVVDEYLDKEEGTALLLQPGQATQVTTFPGESKLEYCANCGILVPSHRCSKHTVHNENDGAPSNEPNVGPFNFRSKKKNNRSKNKKPQFALTIEKN
jgi:hypothetical protein